MIRNIPKHSVVDYQVATVAQVTVKSPISVDAICPYCKRKVNFHITWKNGINPVVNHIASNCPACKGYVTFLQIIGKPTPGQLPFIGEYFMYPGIELRQPLEGLAEAYQSTINVMNAQEWTATAVLCRRLLEGIIQHHIPSGNKPLAAQLKDLPTHVDLSKPILTLADAIRKGGNIGAHFDLQKNQMKRFLLLWLIWLTT